MRKDVYWVMNHSFVHVVHVFIPGDERFPGSQGCYLTAQTPLIACRTVPGVGLKNASLLRLHSLRPTIVLQDLGSAELI